MISSDSWLLKKSNKNIEDSKEENRNIMDLINKYINVSLLKY